jgi:hypothetical protein
VKAADRLCLTGAELERIDALLARQRAMDPPGVMRSREGILFWVLSVGFDHAEAWLTSIEASRAPVAPAAQVEA